MSFETDLTEDEIRDEVFRAMDGKVDNPDRFRGMSYEDGIIYALEWILGDLDGKPMDD